MPEERKPAPLPPLPWKVILDPWYSRTQVQDAEGCIIAEIIGTDEEAIAVADLFCRAPALELAAKELVLAVDRLDHPDPERLFDLLRAALENAK